MRGENGEDGAGRQRVNRRAGGWGMPACRRASGKSNHNGADLGRMTQTGNAHAISLGGSSSINQAMRETQF